MNFLGQPFFLFNTFSVIKYYFSSSSFFMGGGYDPIFGYTSNVNFLEVGENCVALMKVLQLDAQRTDQAKLGKVQRGEGGNSRPSANQQTWSNLKSSLKCMKFELDCQ